MLIFFPLIFFVLMIFISYNFKIENDEADIAVHRLACTYERSKVALCPPAVLYQPFYFFTRYPAETTKLWNLINLLTPTTWILTFSAIFSIVIMLKIITAICSVWSKTSIQDVTLVPFR